MTTRVAKCAALPYPKSMPVHALVSEEEYLRTSYEPDCEFSDGELVGRNVGERGHCKLQKLLMFYLCHKEALWNIDAYQEIRIRLRPGLYRIPDIAIFPGPEITEAVPTSPPLVWIEILSPEDRHLRVNRKVRELLEYGVRYVWVIDPETLESELHSEQGATFPEGGVLRIPDTPIEIPLHSLQEFKQKFGG
jgi:Uma2 family endonuclease